MSKADGCLWRQWLAQAYPTITPESEFATSNECQPFVFGLHECAIGTVINQHKKLVAALDSDVIARRIFTFDVEIHVIARPEDYRIIGCHNEMTVLPIKHEL